MNDDPGFVYTNCQVCSRSLRDEGEYEMGMCLPCACQVMGPFPSLDKKLAQSRKEKESCRSASSSSAPA